MMKRDERISLKKEILNFALKEIAEKGVEKLSLREVAKALGVSHAAPYRHFSTKEALIEALTKEGYEKLYFLLDKSLLTVTSSTEKLYQLGYAYVQFSLENRDYFSLMYLSEKKSTDNSELEASSNKIYDLLKNILKERIEQGDYKKENIDTLAFATWAYLHGLVLLWHKQREGKDFPILSGALKTYMKLFENGLKA